MREQCEKCGGTMVGDGFNTIMHCEFADEETYYDKAPDEGPIYCDYTEEETSL